MGFLTSLFGGPNDIVTIVMALAIVLVLILLGLWALKLIFNATSGSPRGRMRRLAVLEAAAVDQKRKLVLIRRDDVEHLLMIGGPHDLVVETGISAPGQQPRRRETQSHAVAPAPQRPATQVVPPRPRPDPTQDEPPESPPVPPRPRPEPSEPVSVDHFAVHPDTVREESAQEPAGASPLERLKEFGRPLTERRQVGVRHPGMQQPAARAEPQIFPREKSGGQPAAHDSAKSGRLDMAPERRADPRVIKTETAGSARDDDNQDREDEQQGAK